MPETNKRYAQALDISRYLTPIGEASAWIGDRKTLAAFASWVFKVDGHPELGAGMSPCAGFLDYRAGLPSPLIPGTAYDGAAFLHKTSGTLIVANRGTETLEDWITNVEAALDICWKQIGPAVSFAADAVEAARRLLGGDISQLLVTGNSLGGALAEGQAALVNAELKARGAQLVGKFSGYCTASAAFGKRIKEYAGQRYPDLAASAFQLKGKLTHLIRARDPILAQHELLKGRLLGAMDDNIASIFVVDFVTEPPPSKKSAPVRRWQLRADASNHNDYYYFRFIDLPKKVHLVKPKSKDFFSEPGEQPDTLRFKLNELPEKYR